MTTPATIARHVRRRFCLRPGDVVRDDGAHDSIACRRGRLWITQTGVARDVILSAGQSFQPQRTGLLVIEALEVSCLERSANDETLYGNTLQNY